MKRRGSGILLHITSLPSRYGIGDFGTGAYQFADFLFETKQTSWQILPLTPTTSFRENSPYSSPSAFAGNPLLIDPESLMKEVRKNNIRVCTLTPSTIASDMSIELGIANKDSEDTVLQPEDFAELIVAGLKLPRRAMLKGASLWSTNP